MTNHTTPTSGAADMPEALRRSTAADGKTELFNIPGYPLMVRAVDFNRIHAESEMRRAALLDEMQKAALAAGQATAVQAVVPAEWPTNGMIDAGRKAAASQGRLLGSGQSLWHVFRAMLAAAPAQPAAQAVVQDDLITIRKPTTSAELLWLLKLAHLVISDVDKTLEETFAPAQPVAQQGAADGFFLLLPQRPKPEAPAGTVGLDWDAYSGAQMLAFGRDSSDAAIAALRTEQPAPAGATEEVENLRKALVYVAFALHDTPQYMLAQGIALIDGDTVRVSRDGWTVEASVNPHRQPAPATQQAVEVRRAELVPGVMHCAKCKFQLNRVTLCVSDGNAYAGNNKTEPCPNGCGPLWPVTWEQEAKNCWKALEEMHERLMAAAAPQPSPAAQATAAPAGDWLWVNDLFEIVDAARAARTPADNKKKDPL